MAENTNQHYVPQYYFKLHNGGRRDICAYLCSQNRTVVHAPIKGQCARPNFYGSKELEELFSQVEAHHASALRAIIQAVSSDDISCLSSEVYEDLILAIAFQRSRTLREAEKTQLWQESFHLELFRNYARQQAPEELRGLIESAIDKGELQLDMDPVRAVLLSIKATLQNAPLLVDLDVRLLRNLTNRPFLFGDAPVVFYNTYYRNVTSRGVLGATTPGLQIFYPITPSTQVMLLDGDVYSGRYKNGPFCDVFLEADVAHLNALQLHQSKSAVYFSNPDQSEYIERLYRAHASRIKAPEVELLHRQGWLVDGKIPKDGMLHSFQRQLSHVLSLSFVDCKPIDEDEYIFRRRSPELYEAHMQSLGESDDAAS